MGIYRKASFDKYTQKCINTNKQRIELSLTAITSIDEKKKKRSLTRF